MAIIRSFDKPFELTDLTEEINLIPNTYGLVNELGIFRNESVAQHTVTVESNLGTLGLLVDQMRGARNTVNRGETRNIRSFAVPHYPQDDYLGPEDLVGKRAYGRDAADTEAEVMQRKLERIRRNHAVTMEFARCFAITTGGIYAPNGTVQGNYYTDFGITRKEVAFDLGNGATNVLGKSREVIDSIQENINSGEVVNNIVALASPEFFDALIAQAKVTDAYRYFTSTQNPNRDGLRSGRYSEFVYGDVRYIRYVGSYKDGNGVSQRLIPAGDCYFLPMGTQDTFISYFSAANKMDLVNTLGEEMYAFVYRDPKMSKVEIETEHNALHLIRRPAAVVRATLNASL